MTPNTMNDDDDVHIDFNSQHTMQSKQNSEAGKGPAVVAIQGVWHLPLTCLTDPGSRSDSTTRINKVSELTMFTQTPVLVETAFCKKVLQRSHGPQKTGSSFTGYCAQCVS